jgi:CheY-like chemotaxis protein
MNSAPIKILLAEDDDGHATLIQRNLQRVGLSSEISRIRDGQEAIDYVARRTQPNSGAAGGSLIMLLDINMPRLDGVTVLKMLKVDPRTARIPVIMLSR